MEDKLTRIAIHWSVTSYAPSPDCLAHYHFSVGGSGEIHKGNKPPESNLPSSVAKGNYMPHLGGGNSGTIGVCMCSMLGYKNKKKMGDYPITVVQFEAMCKLVAQLSKKYKIAVDSLHVFTHYEFGLTHPDTPSAGKIDINFLPCHPELKENEVGDFIRTKIKWYLAKL